MPAEQIQSSPSRPAPAAQPSAATSNPPGQADGILKLIFFFFSGLGRHLFGWFSISPIPSLRSHWHLQGSAVFFFSSTGNTKAAAWPDP